MCLFPKMFLDRNPRRAGVCSAAADERTVGLMYVTISGVPTQCHCKTLPRGSARPAALWDQLTLQGSILRSHRQDDREPRPTNLLHQTLELTPIELGPGLSLNRGFAPGRFRPKTSWLLAPLLEVLELLELLPFASLRRRAETYGHISQRIH